MKSFSPEKAQTELAWNLDARLKFVAGAPPVGGPLTSPANAAPEPTLTKNAAQTAAAERECFIASSFGCEPKRAGGTYPRYYGRVNLQDLCDDTRARTAERRAARVFRNAGSRPSRGGGGALASGGRVASDRGARACRRDPWRG